MADSERSAAEREAARLERERRRAEREEVAPLPGTPEPPDIDGGHVRASRNDFEPEPDEEDDDEAGDGYEDEVPLGTRRVSRRERAQPGAAAPGVRRRTASERRPLAPRAGG